MVVASTLLIQSRKHKRNAKKASGGDLLDLTILLLGVTITLGATILAYMTNKNQGQPCALAMAFVAFSFPEIYLLQAGVRAMLGHYKLSTSNQVSDAKTIQAAMQDIKAQGDDKGTTLTSVDSTR